MNKFITFILIILQISLATARPLDICSFLYSPDYSKLKKVHRTDAPPVRFSEAKHEYHFKSVEETLAGNLSTVRRIENKLKTGYDRAYKYLNKLGGENFNLSSIKNSKEKFHSFVKGVAAGKIGNINLRNLLPPPGAIDRTFTYYTKAITAPSGSKHQFRFRTYIREIDPREIGSEEVMGYLEDSQIIGITKVNGSFNINYYEKIGKELNIIKSKKSLSLKSFKSMFQNMDIPRMYAYPHGKGIKMEVKSRLPDELNSSFLDKMLGQPYVQKLDVPITMKQVEKLFGGASHKSSNYLRIVDEVKQEMRFSAQRKYGDIGSKRVDAFFDLYDDALKLDPNFNTLAGATEYQRFAFELPIPDKVNGNSVSIQTTFDYDQGTRFVYTTEGKLQNPIEVIEHQTKMTSIDGNPLHIEFKAPQQLVEKVAADPMSVSGEFRHYIKTFNDFKPTSESRGKFNYIFGDY